MVKQLNLKYSAISKVLPCVYDDSLSYYEVLCKVKDKLNEVIDVDNAQSDAINDLGEQSAERYNEFEQKILHDLEEMENKLEGEISAGDDEVLQTLSELIANLSNEIDDISATVSGVESSVAEAVQTANSASEAVNELSNDVETVTQNVADLSTAMDNVDSSLQQLNRNVNTNTDAIADNASAINLLDGRVTDIEEEIEGGMVFADVDSALSTTSTNPVENQVITRKIQQVEGNIPTSAEDLSDVNFTNPSAGQLVGFDSNGDLINMNAPAGVTVVDNLNSTSSTDALSANMGKNLKDQIDALPTPPSVIDNLTSTSTTDALSANMGKNLKDQIDALPTPPTVIDNLTSTSATDALSAKQGKNLKDQIDALPTPPTVVDNLTSSSTTDALSANQGKNLKDQIDALPTPPAVVDNLTSFSTTDALSANQGRLLGESVANGKAQVALAITNKGVQTASDATFSTLANNIAQIPTGMNRVTLTDSWTANYQRILSNKTIAHNLGVVPQFVVVHANPVGVYCFFFNGSGGINQQFGVGSICFTSDNPQKTFYMSNLITVTADATNIYITVPSGVVGVTNNALAANVSCRLTIDIFY